MRSGPPTPLHWWKPQEKHTNQKAREQTLGPTRRLPPTSCPFTCFFGQLPLQSPGQTTPRPGSRPSCAPRADSTLQLLKRIHTNSLPRRHRHSRVASVSSLPPSPVSQIPRARIRSILPFDCRRSHQQWPLPPSCRCNKRLRRLCPPQQQPGPPRSPQLLPTL